MKSYLKLAVAFVASGSLLAASGAMAADNTITLSFSQTSGNSDTTTMAASYQFGKEIAEWSFSSTGDYLYKEDDGDETANKLKIDNSLDRKLTEKIALGVINFLYIDRFSGYDFRGGIGPAVFYKPFDNLSLSVGATYTYNNYTDGSTDSYAQGEVKGNYERKLFENLLFSQSLSYQVSFEDSDDYFVHSKTSFKVPFSTNLAMSVSYLIDYQNLLPEGTEYHTDKTLLVGITYKF